MYYPMNDELSRVIQRDILRTVEIDRPARIARRTMRAARKRQRRVDGGSAGRG